MAGEPNELPEGGEGGGGGTWGGGWRGEWPAELPVARLRDRAVAQLLREVLALRVRVQALESAQIAARVMGGGGGGAMLMSWGGIGGPNELPEGGEGGEGGGWGGWRGEFPGNPPELPVDNILQTISELENRFAAFEGRVVSAIEGLQAQVQQLSR
jgi:hypothetical protein